MRADGCAVRTAPSIGDTRSASPGPHRSRIRRIRSLISCLATANLAGQPADEDHVTERPGDGRCPRRRPVQPPGESSQGTAMNALRYEAEAVNLHDLQARLPCQPPSLPVAHGPEGGPPMQPLVDGVRDEVNRVHVNVEHESAFWPREQSAQGDHHATTHLVFDVEKEADRGDQVVRSRRELWLLEDVAGAELRVLGLCPGFG